MELLSINTISALITIIFILYHLYHPCSLFFMLFINIVDLSVLAFITDCSYEFSHQPWVMLLVLVSQSIRWLIRKDSRTAHHGAPKYQYNISSNHHHLYFVSSLSSMFIVLHVVYQYGPTPYHGAPKYQYNISSNHHHLYFVSSLSSMFIVLHVVYQYC